MRERKQLRVFKFSSLSWLVNFLNICFDSDRPRDRSKVEKFLAEEWPRDDTATALKVQRKIIDLIDLAIKANSPEGLVMELNEYVAANSNTWDPLRSRPPVHAYWFVRRLKDVPVIDAGQTMLKMGKSKWLIQRTVLVNGTEGRVLMSISQCLENGELGRLRRCMYCRGFFTTDDARRKFCKLEHQRAYDRGASKARVRKSRERQKLKALRVQPPERKTEKSPPSPVIEPQRFTDFLTRARGSILPGSQDALFIKRKIPGEWQTVISWLKMADKSEKIWNDLPEQTKRVFRDYWGQA